MRVLAVHGIKGGIGKTTAAVNLAYEATQCGARVLLWDLDPQGGATFLFRGKPVVKGGAKQLAGVRGELGSHLRATELAAVHLVPSDFSLRLLDLALDAGKRPRERIAALLEPMRPHYDVAILDCAPGVTLTNEAVFAAADILLAPTIPTPLSARTLTQLASFLRQLDSAPELLPFVSIYDRRKALQRSTVELLRREFPAMLATEIPNAGIVERMASEVAPLGLFAPRSAAALAFRTLWLEVQLHLWG